MGLESTTTSNKRQNASSPDGNLLGQSATDKVGFYGTTPATQPTAAAQAAVTDTGGGTANAATGVTTITGTYNSTILANAFATVIAQTNAIRSALVTLGIMKGS